MGARWRFRSGSTNRTTLETPETEADFAEAQDWARSAVPSKHRGLAKLRLALSSVPHVAVPATCYRARPCGGSPLTHDQLGPPPAIIAREGRYNECGHSVLYLSDSLDGVHRELTAHYGVAPICIAAFSLPPHLDLADFASVPDDCYLNYVMFFAERAMDPHGLDGESLVFSRMVAHTVKEQGFDGMRVSGVRGGAGVWYSNLVVFDPSDWESWIRRTCAVSCGGAPAC